MARQRVRQVRRNSKARSRHGSGWGHVGRRDTRPHEEHDDYSPDPGLTRTERLPFAAAALRGVLAGAARAITAWLLEQHLHVQSSLARSTIRPRAWATLSPRRSVVSGDMAAALLTSPAGQASRHRGPHRLLVLRSTPACAATARSLFPGEPGPQHLTDLNH